MSTSLKILIVSALLAASVAPFSSTARAAPIRELLAIGKSTRSTVQPVYWRGRGWGWGAPVGGGLIAGALISGALAAPYYAPGYYPGPAYGVPAYGAPAYGPPPEDAIGYCMQRFKSYDPASGTYLGYDGYRHPCP